MRTTPGPVIALLIACGTLALAEDNDRNSWDHYIQVDVGQKNYDILLHRHDDERLRGEFTESIVVSPTARICSMDKDSNWGLQVTFGLAYGHFRADDLEADTVECHLGLGGTARLTSWADLNLMVSGGAGWTRIDLPTGYHTWDGFGIAEGGSGHVEALATLSFDLWGVLLTTNAGYRYTGMVLRDLENEDRFDDYAIHGFVVGAGLGFTF